MNSRRQALGAAFTACAPLPALTMGILAMRQMGVSTVAWSINVASTVCGLLIWFAVRRLPPLSQPTTRTLLAAASLATVLLPFASEGMLRVYRWISVGGLRLHASAIAAPLIILCVAASHSIRSALAISTASAIILALQPDAAQTVSVAAACAVVLVRLTKTQPRPALLSVVLLLIVSVASFARRDPLPPVAHVEGIFAVVASRGPGSAAMATLSLFLLPMPFFVAWLRHQHATALALGVYVTMTLLAPAWGTFPVPVMGYGASPILGYYLALAIGLGGRSRFEEQSRNTPSSVSLP